MLMLGLLIGFGLFGVVLFMLHWYKEHGRDYCGEFFGFGMAVSITVGIAFALAITFPVADQHYRSRTINEIDQSIGIYEVRRDNLSAIVQAELSIKYPQHEKEIYKSMVPGERKGLLSSLPGILLTFPGLKSDKIFMETVKRIIDLQDSVYKLRVKRVKTWVAMKWAKDYPLHIWVPSRESFGLKGK